MKNITLSITAVGFFVIALGVTILLKDRQMEAKLNAQQYEYSRMICVTVLSAQDASANDIRRECQKLDQTAIDEVADFTKVMLETLDKL